LLDEVLFEGEELYVLHHEADLVVVVVRISLLLVFSLALRARASIP